VTPRHRIGGLASHARWITGCYGHLVDTDDIVAITQVLHLYGHILDAAAWDRLGEIFTEDATFDVSSFGGGVLNGLAGIYGAFSKQAHPPAHHVSNTYVEERDGEVWALTKLFGPDWKGRMVIGDYRDRMRKTDAGWRVCERVAYVHRYWTGARTPIPW